MKTVTVKTISGKSIGKAKYVSDVTVAYVSNEKGEILTIKEVENTFAIKEIVEKYGSDIYFNIVPKTEKLVFSDGNVKYGIEYKIEEIN